MPTAKMDKDELRCIGVAVATLLIFVQRRIHHFIRAIALNITL